MDTDILAKELARFKSEGKKIHAVIATAGAFGSGAFDDIDTIANYCRKFKTWFHVDGAHGASALFSSKYKHRLKGINKADSLTWDPHKMLMMPLSASVLLVKSKETLKHTFAFSSASAQANTDWNLGTQSFMASRRADAFKLWACLQRYGAGTFEAIYDHLCDLTLYLYQILSAKQGFEVFHKPDCNLLAFRFIGSADLNVDLDELNIKIGESFNVSGEGKISSLTIEGHFALRATAMTPFTSESHIDRLVNQLGEHGRKFSSQNSAAIKEYLCE